MPKTGIRAGFRNDVGERMKAGNAHVFYFQFSQGGGTSVVQGWKIFLGQFKVRGGQKMSTRGVVAAPVAVWGDARFYRALLWEWQR